MQATMGPVRTGQSPSARRARIEEERREGLERAMRPARPRPMPDGIIRHFTRGNEHPRGVVWFGARSFWGHLRHLIASAIAAESVDARDWMTPDEPRALLARITDLLGGNPHAATLVEALDRDLYIDFFRGRCGPRAAGTAGAPPLSLGLGTFLIGISAGIFVFGGYLAVLTLLGYENTQAFTVLDHPGFKHFVRLRVRADSLRRARRDLRRRARPS